MAGIQLQPPFRDPVDERAVASGRGAEVDLRRAAHPGTRLGDRRLDLVFRVAHIDVEAARFPVDLPERPRRIPALSPELCRMPRRLETIHPLGRSSSRTVVWSPGRPSVKPCPREWGRDRSSHSSVRVWSPGDGSTRTTAVPESLAPRIVTGFGAATIVGVQGSSESSDGPAVSAPRTSSVRPVSNPGAHRAWWRARISRGVAIGRRAAASSFRGFDQRVELLARQDPQLGARREPLRDVRGRDLDADDLGDPPPPRGRGSPPPPTGDGLGPQSSRVPTIAGAGACP